MKEMFTSEEIPDVLVESNAKTEFEFEKCLCGDSASKINH